MQIEAGKPLLPMRIRDLGAFWHAGLGVRGNVASWTDQSRNQHVVSEGTNQPIRTTHQGRPVIRFDGVNDFLKGTLTFPSTNVHTTVLAYRMADSARANITVEWGGDGFSHVPNGAHMQNTAGNRWYRAVDTWPTRRELSPAGFDTSPHVMSAVNSVAQLTGYLDGASVGTDAVPTIPAGAATQLSFAGNMDAGQLSEVDIYGCAIYTRDLTARELIEIERYMGHLAGLKLHA